MKVIIGYVDPFNESGYDEYTEFKVIHEKLNIIYVELYTRDIQENNSEAWEALKNGSISSREWYITGDIHDLKLQKVKNFKEVEILLTEYNK